MNHGTMEEFKLWIQAMKPLYQKYLHSEFIRQILERVVTVSTDLIIFSSMFCKKTLEWFVLSLKRNGLESQRICEKTKKPIESS